MLIIILFMKSILEKDLQSIMNWLLVIMNKKSQLNTLY